MSLSLARSLAGALTPRLFSGHLHLDVRGPPAQPAIHRVCQFPLKCVLSLITLNTKMPAQKPCGMLEHSRLSNRCRLMESWTTHLPHPSTTPKQSLGPGLSTIQMVLRPVDFQSTWTVTTPAQASPLNRTIPVVSLLPGYFPHSRE